MIKVCYDVQIDSVFALQKIKVRLMSTEPL
jgi:hypothetical protein